MKINESTKGFSAVISSTIALALGASVVSRLIVAEISLFYQGFSRVFFCAILMFLWLFFSRGLRFKLLTSDIKWLIGRSFGGFLGFLFFYIPVNNISIGATYFSYFAGTLTSGYLFAWLLFKEKITKQEMIFMCVALVGLLLVYSEFNFLQLNGYVSLAFIGGVGYTFWANFAKKLKGKYSNAQITMIDFIIGAMIYGAGSLLSGEVWTLPMLNVAWSASLGLGLTWIFAGLLIVYGFKRLNTAIGSLLLLIEIPISVLIGGLFYKEELSLFTWIGGGMILIACAMPEIFNLITRKSK